MNEDGIDGGFQTEITLFSKGNVRKNKSSVECFYYHKFGHIAWNCKVHAKVLLKGKLIESEDLVDFEENPKSNKDDKPNEEPLKLF